MKRSNLLKKYVGLLFAAIIIGLTVLFFTNDFGLVDLRKTAVVIGVGLDWQDDQIMLTAQVAVPQPAENGENTQFTTVTGKGDTVANALNEVNVKSGFYPKLVFCKLIILGESCFKTDVSTLLNYFYGNEYTGLTPALTACKGSAQELISTPLPLGYSTTDFIERLLSDEAQKTANVSAVDLNTFGQTFYGKSRSGFMPYVETNQPGEESGGGDSSQGGGQSGEQNGGSGSQGGGSSQSEGGEQGGDKPLEFVCDKTVLFADGYCKGIIDRDMAFALNLITAPVKHTYIECCQIHRTVLGLRNCDGKKSFTVENGVPVLKLSFSAVAKIQDKHEGMNDGNEWDERPDAEILTCGENQIKKRMTDLFEYSKKAGCDVFNVRDMLYKTQNKYYDMLSDKLFENLTLSLDIKLKPNE